MAKRRHQAIITTVITVLTVEINKKMNNRSYTNTSRSESTHGRKNGNGESRQK